MKKPWLAALFNLLPGAGYLYLGTRKIFAWLLISSTIFAIADGFNPEVARAAELYPFTVLSITACALVFAAFAADAFLEAKRVNEHHAKRSTKED